MAWGKFLGLLFGFSLTGSIFGALFGLIIGSLFDRGLILNLRGNNILRHSQHIFFKATFLVMGHVAKADGRVSKREIHVARTIMQRMQLNDRQERQAIDYFTQGKQANFNLQQTLAELLRACHQHHSLLRMFIEIQYQAAMADGYLGGVKEQILQDICRQLGFATMFTGQQHRQSGQSYQYHRQYSRAQTERPLQAAYKLLEISSTAGDHEVKRAYRKLMSQHHPDKLIAQGLPEEMVKLATDKAQEIQRAYELIKKARS